MSDAAVGGFTIAVIAVIVVLSIRLWVKAKLERWSYDLTRETLNRLRESDLRLDSIQRNQERILSSLERIERVTHAQTK